MLNAIMKKLGYIPIAEAKAEIDQAAIAVKAWKDENMPMHDVYKACYMNVMSNRDQRDAEDYRN